MTVWSALAGGFAGTLVLTTALAAANQLGSRASTSRSCSARRSPRTAPARASSATCCTSWPASRSRSATTRCSWRSAASTWWLGALFGLGHALFAGTALVNTLLPLVHPRMGSPMTAAHEAPLLEPPGFMLAELRAGDARS